MSHPSITASEFVALLHRAQAGDRPAMDRVLEVLQPQLEPLARQYADPVKPVESTADLLQESCLRAWSRIGSFEGGENDEETFGMFRSWIGQIVRRMGIDAKRTQERRKRSPDGDVLRLGAPGSPDTSAGDGTAGGGGIDPPAVGASPSAIVRESELSERIDRVLDALPDETDAAMIRHYFYDALAIAEIAGRLDLPYHRVRDRFWVLMRRLKADLGEWL